MVREKREIYVFSDFGSGLIEFIEEKLNFVIVVVVDYYLFEKDLFLMDFYVFVNLVLFGVNSVRDLSGFGVVYFVVREMNRKNRDMVYVVIVGVVGDM